MKEALHILYGNTQVGSLGYDRKKDEISLEGSGTGNQPSTHNSRLDVRLPPRL